MESIIRAPGVQDLVREWMALGCVKEARSMLHVVFAARSLATTRDIRARIDRERDIARLESWLMAAATATAIADVFPEDEPYAWDSMLENPDVQELLRDRERRGYERGRIDEARSVLYRVLASRSIAVTADERTRIHGEHDPARLEAWATNAVHAKTIGDIFRDG